MQSKKISSAGNSGEHRLIFLDGNPEAMTTSEPETDDSERGELVDPAKIEQMEQNASVHGETRKEHEQAENQERNQVLPPIEEKMKADKQSEQNEQPLQDAERFASEARDTLQDPHQKEIFDAAMDALSPQEKIAYYRDRIVWFDSCVKQIKPSYVLTPADARDIQYVKRGAFAQNIVFSAFDPHIQRSSGLQRLRDAAKADYLMNVSEADRLLADQASDKMVQAAKQYLQSHPETAKIVGQQQKEAEQELNAISSDESIWQPEGEASRYFKSPEEMKKDASKELQNIVDEASGKKGIKFELLPASQHDKETGERLSLKIVPKDKNQSEQVQEVTKKIAGSFEKKQQGIVKRKEVLIVTNDAQKLKECIASLVTHSYTEKKISK